MVRTFLTAPALEATRQSLAAREKIKELDGITHMDQLDAVRIGKETEKWYESFKFTMTARSVRHVDHRQQLEVERKSSNPLCQKKLNSGHIHG